MDQDSSRSDDRERQVNEIITAYLEAIDAGQMPDRQEWLRRYPQFAAELEAFLAENAWVDRMAVPSPPAAVPRAPMPPKSVISFAAETMDSPQPILAQAVGQAEPAGRWRGWNLVVAGLTAAVLICVVVGAVVTGYLAPRERQWADALQAARRAETQARRDRDLAERRANDNLQWARKTEGRAAAGAENPLGLGAAPEKPLLAAERSGSQPAVHLPVVSSLVGADGKWKLPPGTPQPAVAPFDEKKAKEHQEGWAKHLGVPVEIANSIGMKVVLIPPGEFEMGSPGQDSHKVRITKPFYLGKYEVTQEEWEAVVGKAQNPSGYMGPKNPVEKVSWEDCQVFLKKLGQKCGVTEGSYRLPTEAQWEYTCRAGSTGGYGFGSAEADLDDYGWFDKNSENKTHPVGEKKPNAWGLYDIHGNVWEWCADWHDQNYYKVSPLSDPTGPYSGWLRVNRGGCWDGGVGHCRSANRNGNEPGSRNSDLGLRVSLVFADTADERAKIIRATDAAEPTGGSTVPVEVEKGPGTAAHVPTESATPKLPVNGLAETDFIVPTEFPSHWRSKNVFARIIGPGRIVFPTLPVSSYVLEAEVTSRNPGGKLVFRSGDRDNATELVLEHMQNHVDKDVKQIRCHLFKCDPFGVNWGGDRDFEPGTRLQLKIVVPDGQKRCLYVNGLPALSADGVAADLTLEIRAERDMDATIHTCALRKLDEEDVKKLGLQMPQRRISIDLDAAAARLSRDTVGLGEVPQKGNAFRAPTTATVLNWISPGEFVMGAPGGIGDHLGKGAQKVRLTKGYWIGRYEVTQGEWERLMGNNPSRVQGSPDLPVNWISWVDAVRFCRKLTDAETQHGRVPEGHEYRLPTEAEWEYACLAGAEGQSASDVDSPTGRLSRELKAPLWRELSQELPNAWGLCDMLGNVPEWCADAWRPYPADGQTRVMRDRFEPGRLDVDRFVVRGGPFLHWDKYMGSASARFRATPTVAGDYRGFRLVLGRELKLWDAIVPAEAAAGTLNPHGGIAMPSDGTDKIQENNGTLDLDKAHWTVPKSWVRKTPKSTMLQAEYGIPAVTGDKDDSRLTISRAGGSVADNIARWKGQFKKLENESQETIDAGGIKITLVDLTGTFDDGMMGPPVTRPDYRMLGAIFKIPNEDVLHFIKCYGPKKTITDRVDEIREFLRSLKMDN